MSKKRRNQVKQKGKSSHESMQHLRIKQEVHSGPIPSPEQLSAYDKVIPGLAERIVKHAEVEQEHRHNMEQRAMRQPHREALLGQVFGLIIGVVGIVSAAWLISKGYPIAGSVFAGGMLVALVTAFIKGRGKQ